MNENKIKHLEFIQQTILRMSNNSFLIKGWMITLLSAMFALAAKDSKIFYITISCFTIPIFWYLNGYFLCQERRYRKLYDEVRVKEEKEIDFCMDSSKFKNAPNTCLDAMFAKSVFPIYIIAIVITIALIIIT